MQVEIFKWDVGTEPRGWKPGDQLVVRNAHYHEGPIAALIHTSALAHEQAGDEQPFYAVEFHHAARAKVLVWLRRFAHEEHYAIISKQII